MADEVDVTATFIATEKDKNLPFVALFPHGVIPSPAIPADRLREMGNSMIALKADKADDRRTPGKNLLISPGDKVDYVGSTKSDDSCVKNPCQYFLGVLKRNERVMHFIPIAGGKVMKMEARVHGVDYDTGIQIEDELAEKEAKNVTAEERLRKRRNLTEEFGSKQRKRKDEAMQKGVLTDDNIGAAETVNTILKKASEKDGTLTMQEIEAKLSVENKKNIPPHNLTAETKAEVYPIDGIISHKEWSTLKCDLLFKAANGDATALKKVEKFFPLFVSKRLSKLTVPGDEEGNHTRAKLLFYITYLQRFLQAPVSLSFRIKSQTQTGSDAPEEVSFTSADVPSISKQLRIPETSVETFIERFSSKAASSKPGESEKFTRTKVQKQLLLNSILVLALHVDDFSVGLADLSKDLRMADEILAPYFHSIGCKAGKGKDGTVFNLNLPLTFPKVGKFSRK